MGEALDHRGEPFHSTPKCLQKEEELQHEASLENMFQVGLIMGRGLADGIRYGDLCLRLENTVDERRKVVEEGNGTGLREGGTHPKHYASKGGRHLGREREKGRISR